MWGRPVVSALSRASLSDRVWPFRIHTSKEALAALKAKNARATNSGCIDLGKMKGEQFSREQAIAASVDRARDLRERRLEAMRIERDGK